MADKKPGLLKRIFSFGFGSKKQVPADLDDQASEQIVHEQQETDLGHEIPEAEHKPEEPVALEPADVDEEPEAAAKSEPVVEQEEAAEPATPPPAPKTEKPGKLAKPKSKAEPQTLAAKPQAIEKSAPQPKPKPKSSKAAPEPKAKKTPPTPQTPVPDLDKQVTSPAGLDAPAPNKQVEAPKQGEKTAATPRPAGKVRLFEDKPKPQAQVETDEAARKEGWFARMRKGLSRSSEALTGNITAVFTRQKLDDDTLQDLEDVLIQADLGVETAMAVTGSLSAQRYGKDVTDTEVRQVMASEISKVLAPVALPLELNLEHRPHVILVVGVNGSGKTTTIGKLSAKLRSAGLSTLLVAGDTFRAAAIEQLKIWGERTQAPVMARELGADAAGLAFDAFNKAKQDGQDVLLMDTAGRLQNKTELMAELEKIIRVLKKQDPSAPHTVLLTLDATTGQNALNQVEIFEKVAGVNGLVMTKLDGTARGGILVSISAKHKLPVYFIGVGEGVDDLEPFEADEFARSIAGLDRTTQLEGAG